jgi:hypothetical protein
LIVCSSGELVDEAGDHDPPEERSSEDDDRHGLHPNIQAVTRSINIPTREKTHAAVRRSSTQRFTTARPT